MFEGVRYKCGIAKIKTDKGIVYSWRERNIRGNRPFFFCRFSTKKLIIINDNFKIRFNILVKPRDALPEF